MKLQIRNSVFETNSSSTHSLTIASPDEFKNWKDGKCLLDNSNHEFIDLTEGILRNEEYINKLDNRYDKKFKWETLDWYYKELGCLTYDEYNQMLNNLGFEEFITKQTTPHAEKIVVFGYWGMS